VGCDAVRVVVRFMSAPRPFKSDLPTRQGGAAPATDSSGDECVTPECAVPTPRGLRHTTDINLRRAQGTRAPHFDGRRESCGLWPAGHYRTARTSSVAM